MHPTSKKQRRRRAKNMGSLYPEFVPVQSLSQFTVWERTTYYNFSINFGGKIFFGVKVGGKDIMRWERWQGTMSIIKHKFQQNSSLWFSVVVLVRFILFMLLLPRTRAFWHLFPLNLCHIIHTLTVHRFIISSAILRTQQFIQFLP